MDCYFLLDEVLNTPHAPLTIKTNTFMQDKATKSIDNLLAHFDDFSYKNFFNINRVDLLDKDKPKFIFNFMHMPSEHTPHVTPLAKKLLTKNKNVYLMIFSVLEYHLDVKQLINECKKNSLPLQKIIVVCSNIELHGKSFEGIKFICINFWESYSRFHHQILPEISYATPENFKKDILLARKVFLNFNRNIKPHRIWWYYCMIRQNVIDKGHVSYHLPNLNNKEYYQVSRSTNTTKRIPPDLEQDFLYALVREMPPRTLDPILRTNIINYKLSSNPFFRDSVVSIITESDASVNFITEKTYKSIVNLHPFFIIGNPDQHSLLRARGYHTFEELFQLERVTNYEEGVSLCNWIQNTEIENLKRTVATQYIDKLIYNQQLFFERQISWKTIEKELIKTANEK